MELELAKGVRDFAPEEKILRDKIIEKIKQVFELYGYLPLETPVIERYDVMTAKDGAGQESDSVSEIFQLTDQGGRKLGLRFEFTFALARYVGMNKDLKLPFKRYQIGPVFRDGPIKAGRYKEFYQCDVDVVGNKELSADAEIITLLSTLFNKLDLDVNIEVNSRKLLKEMMVYAKIPESKQNSTIVVIDKLKKIGNRGVIDELREKSVTEDSINNLMKLVEVNGDNEQKLEKLKKALGESEAIKELENLFSWLKTFNTEFVFLPSLARGLGYYTGPIFEVFLKDESILSCSLAGGGRWDNMTGNYIGDPNAQYPATGVGIGLEPIIEVVKKKEGMKAETTTKVFIIPIGTTKEAIALAQKLRAEEIPTDLDLSSKSITKNLEYASKYNIPFTIIIGKKELEAKKYNLRDMSSGKEALLSLNELLEVLK